MNITELEHLYKEAYKSLKAERNMRLFVFRHDPIKLNAKLKEIDRLVDIITTFKDELKPHCDPSPIQNTLFPANHKAPD